MSVKNYDELCKSIIEKVGGKDNIQSVTNCITRLRFELKDDSIPDTEAIKAIDGVSGVVSSAGQYQVIIGPEVTEVVKTLKNQLGLTDTAVQIPNLGKKDNLYNRFVKTISRCTVPAMGALAGCGILKGLLTVLAICGALSAESGTYKILYGAADAVFYFMPLIIAVSAADVFGSNKFVAIVIAGALIYPGVAGTEGLTFLGIPISTMTYTSTLFPALVATWLSAKLEDILKKIIPDLFKLMIIPLITIAVVVPVIYLAIGPVTNVISNGVLVVVKAIYNTVPVIAGFLLGACWQLTVLLGIHQAMGPIIMSEYLAYSCSQFDACIAIAVWGLCGMSLGHALATKDKKAKGAAFAAFATNITGLTEPSIYTVGLKNFKYYVCSMIGSGFSGALFGLIGETAFGFGAGGIFAAPLFVNPDGTMGNFIMWVVGVLCAVGISAVLCYIVTKREEAKEIRNS